MAKAKKNTIVVLEPSAQSAMELVKLLAEKDVANIVSVNSQEDAIQTIVSYLPCMLICSIIDNQEVHLRIQLFKRLETSIKQHGLKIYVVTTLKNQQLSDTITQKMGIADYIVEPVPVRTMQFKANLQLKALDSFRRQQEMKKAAEEKVVIKKLDNGKRDGLGGDTKAHSKPALQTSEDTFLFKNSGIRKAGKKYTIELEGPDPSTGEWVRQGDNGDAQNSWRWVPDDEREPQAKGNAPKDGWVHKGEKPVFNEANQKWAMTSENPSLTFQEDGKTIAEKVGLDSWGEVFVAEDSTAAEENLRKNRAKVKSGKNGVRPAWKSEIEPLEDSDSDEPEANDKDTNSEDPISGLLGKKGETIDLLEKSNVKESENIQSPTFESGSSPKEGGSIDEVLGQIVPKLDKSQFVSDEDSEDEPFARQRAKRKRSLKEDGITPLEIEAARNSRPKDSEEDDDFEPLIRDKKNKKKQAIEFDQLTGLLGKSGTLKKEADDELDNSLLGHAGTETGEDEEDGDSRQRSLKVEELDDSEGAFSSRRGKLKVKKDDASDLLASLRGQRDKLMGEIQGLLGDSNDRQISSEEEEQLREELGLKDRSELNGTDLLKRKRLKAALLLKEKLTALDEKIHETMEDEPDDRILPDEVDDSDETEEKKKRETSGGSPKGIRAAYDSFEDEEEPFESRRISKLKKKEKDTKAGNNDIAKYLPEESLLPVGNAWEKAEEYFVYLEASIHYRGFNTLEEILPLWIFEGEDPPKLLDKTKQWRFLGELPIQARTVSEIPHSVRDFLLSLRDELNETDENSENEKKRPNKEEAEEDTEGSVDGEVNSENDDSDIDKRKHRKFAEKTLASGRTKSQNGGRDDKEEEYSEDTIEEIGPESDPIEEDDPSDEPFAKHSRKNRATRTVEEDKIPEEEPGPKTELSRLRAKLDSKEEPDSDQVESEEVDREESTRRRPKANSRDAASGDKEQEEISVSSAEEIGEPTGNDAPTTASSSLANSKSEGVRKFLERRKKNKNAAAPAPAQANETKVLDPSSSFLGIYVTLSDAYGPVNDPSQSLCKVLASVENTFRDCAAFVTTVPDKDGNSEVLHRSINKTMLADSVPLGSGISEPIMSYGSGSEEILGYLHLQMAGERQRFSEDEETAFRKMASQIWPLVYRTRTKVKRNAA